MARLPERELKFDENCAGDSKSLGHANGASTAVQILARADDSAT